MMATGVPKPGCTSTSNVDFGDTRKERSSKRLSEHTTPNTIYYIECKETKTATRLLTCKEKNYP